MEQGGSTIGWVAAGILALLAIVGVAVWLAEGTTGEVLEAAAKDGEWQLRDPMRPIRGEQRVLVLALDGVGDETLRTLVGQGRMPRLAQLFGAEEAGGVYANAWAAIDAVSILPSTTMAAWVSVFTGAPAGKTGVPGNEWFDRDRVRFFAPGPTSVEDHEHTAKMYTEGLLDGQIAVPTLYELVDLRAHVTLAPVARGADLLVTPAVADVAALFGALAQGLTDDDPVDRAPYEAVDEGVVDVTLQAIEDHGLPDLQVVYMPGIDLYTHLADHPLTALERYLEEVVDPALGRLFDAYQAHGVWQDTAVVLVSDHGHTPVLNDEEHALGKSPDGSPVALLQWAGFRKRPLELDPDAEDYQAAVAYQGAIAYVYLADRSTCPEPGQVCDWTVPPRLEADTLVAAKAFHEANLRGEGIPALQGTLDLILARPPRPHDQPPAPFQVFDGQGLVPLGEWLARHPRDDLILLEERLEDLATGPLGRRSGDILLLAKSGFNRPIEERYYFSNLYHSWHGSPERKDSHVPLIVAHPAKSGGALQAQLQDVVGEQPSQLDVVPVVRALLGR